MNEIALAHIPTPALSIVVEDKRLAHEITYSMDARRMTSISLTLNKQSKTRSSSLPGLSGCQITKNTLKLTATTEIVVARAIPHSTVTCASVVCACI
jgi:hypothetical protein